MGCFVVISRLNSMYLRLLYASQDFFEGLAKFGSPLLPRRYIYARDCIDSTDTKGLAVEWTYKYITMLETS